MYRLAGEIRPFVERIALCNQPFPCVQFSRGGLVILPRLAGTIPLHRSHYPFAAGFTRITSAQGVYSECFPTQCTGNAGGFLTVPWIGRRSLELGSSVTDGGRVPGVRSKVILSSFRK